MINRTWRRMAGVLLLAGCVTLAGAAGGPSMQQQNEALFAQLQAVHQLTDAQMRSVREIFARSGFIGQGNPAISRHPLTPDQCRQRPGHEAGSAPDPDSERICGARLMAPLYDPASSSPDKARACIDRYEFPDIPCAYPVVWVKAREAAQICEAIGKRLCDAHEWEGACQGALAAPDYRFDLARDLAPDAAPARMRTAHNRAHESDKRWSYGPAYRQGVCATGSSKTAGCAGGGFDRCGSNTYPAGSFEGCRSPLGVYDLNGNAAEHMNLPLNPAQMASRGSTELGMTEMKGSWFVFDTYRAHEDWCRWRAPFWHGTRVMDTRSHANYHLGFRCCKTVGQP